MRPGDIPRGECRHCGQPSLPSGSACARCWETVAVKYLDFRCSNLDACPHKVTAIHVHMVHTMNMNRPWP